MKYYLLNVLYRHGERETITYKTLKTDSTEDINDVAHKSIVDEVEPEDDYCEDMGDHYSFYGYEYAVSVDWIRKITQEEYEVFNKYI